MLKKADKILKISAFSSVILFGNPDMNAVKQLTSGIITYFFGGIPEIQRIFDAVVLYSISQT